MPTTIPTIQEIADALEAWAPPATAQSYDNVGLQVGDPRRVAGRVLLALDLTPAVVDEAIARSASLIITHHPLIFRPLRHITTGAFVNNLAFRLAEAGIALYSAHTNLDAADGGVSFALAESLGLEDVQFLEPVKHASFRVTTRVDASDAVLLRTTLGTAGARHIRAFETHSLRFDGAQEMVETVPFYLSAGATAAPFGGEVTFEFVIDEWALPHVRRAIEAVNLVCADECEIVRLEGNSPRSGLGAVGYLATTEPLGRFLQRVGECLEAKGLRYTGAPDMPIETVAVCGGSGSDLIARAISAGADAFVTADVTYHRFFDVLDADGCPRMALIDAGHYETEAMTVQLLSAHLKERFPAVSWMKTHTRTSPVELFVVHE